MRIYIDLENLLSLFTSTDQEKFAAISLFKRQAEVHYSFSPQEFQTNEILKTIVPILNDGVGKSPKPVFEHTFPSRPLRNNCIKQISVPEDLCGVYLINENVDSIKSKGNLLFGNVGDEVKTLMSLMFDFFQFTTALNPQNFESWHDCLPHSFPCTDLILCDSFIFTDQYLWECNLPSLIDVLTQSLNNSRVNLVVFTKANNIHPKLTFDQIRKKIAHPLSKRGLGLDFTLVKTNKFRRHDREIFSNYFNSTSGDSFKYFDSSNNLITKGTNYHLHSHAYVENLKKGLKIVADLQKIIDSLTNSEKVSAIEGAKKSNFLNFS